jgi:hypothetical protein
MSVADSVFLLEMTEGHIRKVDTNSLKGIMTEKNYFSCSSKKLATAKIARYVFSY